MKLRKIRITLAMVFFIGTTLLFLDFTGTLRHWIGWMAKVQFLPAVLALHALVVVGLLLLTLLFGRIYCSIICPLGVFQDFAARLGRMGKRHSYGYSPEKRLLRYTILVVFIAALAAGIPAIYTLLAPYGSYGRMAQSLFQPVYELVNNLLAAGAEREDSYTFYSTDIWMRSSLTFSVALITFFLVGFLAWRNGRAYCNTICPVGTFLSLFARYSWFKVVFNHEKCRQCSACSKSCKAAAINFKQMTVDYSRCVACGDCLEQCNFEALHYVGRGLERKWKAAQKEPQPRHDTKEKDTLQHEEHPDTSRRHFLLAAAMATTASIMAQKEKKVDGGLAPIIGKEAPKRKTPLTPPGSQSARNMAQHCVACQLCVAECPNGVLRPSTHLDTLMQPTMSYERGFCRPECSRCSRVCPTGAIHRVSRAEKSAIHIGHAVWVKSNCVPVTKGDECGNCARHCPAGAITMVPYETPNGEVMVPAVDESHCIGCGACEYLCPSRPFPAIYVEGHEVHRVE